MAQESTETSSPPRSLEFTPTWVVAAVCCVIILISLCAERGLHRLGKFLKHKKQDALFEALQKLKEELMLLGFISLLLTVLQQPISSICIPTHVASHMLPCDLSLFNQHEKYSTSGRRLLSSEEETSNQCPQGKVPLLSLEGLHQLHIFIFVLAVVHVIFCASTMVLGGARIQQWKYWEDSIRNQVAKTEKASSGIQNVHAHHHRQFFQYRAKGSWRKLAICNWTVSFFKQFYGSVTKSDYIALRYGFIKTHCPALPKFDFHKYMMRTLEIDFRKVVGISWYLWLFVVLFLLMDVEGWHTYFWLSFLPLILLVIVGAKLEHIISCLAEEVGGEDHDHEAPTPTPTHSHTHRPHHLQVKPSDKHFWFGRPSIVLYLIHFILFQNSFEIAFFFWILSTYGFRSCFMEKLGYIVPRLIIGVIVQVLCSYSTLPLYALVTQMGSMFKPGMFNEHMEETIRGWGRDSRSSGNSEMHRMEAPPSSSSAQNIHISDQPMSFEISSN